MYLVIPLRQIGGCLQGVYCQLLMVDCRLSAGVCVIFQLLEAGWRSHTVGANSVSYVTQIGSCLQDCTLPVT